jgi:hypothetical protein
MGAGLRLKFPKQKLIRNLDRAVQCHETARVYLFLLGLAESFSYFESRLAGLE